MRRQLDINPKAFGNILNGSKEFELRLYDRETWDLQLGDEIVFTDFAERSRRLVVRVEGLLRYPTFRALFSELDYGRCGPADSREKKMAGIYQYYTPVQEEAAGVVAIKMRLLEQL